MRDSERDAVFDAVWDIAEDAGLADGAGGAAYTRIKDETNVGEGMSPLFLLTYIILSANDGPTGHSFWTPEKALARAREIMPRAVDPTAEREAAIERVRDLLVMLDDAEDVEKFRTDHEYELRSMVGKIKLGD